jgi:hypothetical protein
MALFTVYCDVNDFINNATANMETASLVGGNTTLSASVLAGATSLTIPTGAGTAFGSPSASSPVQAWLLDGAQSEAVNITNITSGTVTLQSALLSGHAAGVSFSSAGVNGCLADTIARASSRLERLCRQGADGTNDFSLYQKSRTEIYRAPSMRCAFDVDNTLIIRPYHNPVVSVANAVVQIGSNTPATLALTNNVLPLNASTIEIPYAQIQGSAPPLFYLYSPFPRGVGAYITVTYVGGPIAGLTLAYVPYKIRSACLLLVADFVAVRINPEGATSVRRGDTAFTFGRKTILQQQAEDELQEYTTPPGM